VFPASEFFFIPVLDWLEQASRHSGIYKNCTLHVHSLLLLVLNLLYGFENS
jgi:hypothetical protein